MHPYLILGIFSALYMAWSIGGNDVANSMGTSVGSRSITLRQAVIIASIANILGAIFLGGHVTETVRKGIVNPDAFLGSPDLLVMGMLASLIAAGLWVQIATHLSLPVSTTHSVIGAIWGFGIVSVGASNIYWGKIATIIFSWFVSPILGGVISYFIFQFIKHRILNTENPFRSAKRYAPLLFGGVIAILVLLVLYKGVKNLPFKLNLITATGAALFVGVGSALLSTIFWNRFYENLDEYRGVEKIFAVLQVITACYMAFSHGANDVANAVGPAAAVYSVAQKGIVGIKVDVPIWMLLLGGVGIALGISTFGYKVIKTVGERITEVTPTRGFSAEFGAATTILVASKLGLPISTTHALVGSVVGVGLARGLKALNLSVVKNIIYSWFVTLPAAGVFSVLLFYLMKGLFH